MDYRRLAIELLQKKYLSGKEKYSTFGKAGSDIVMLMCIDQKEAVLPKDISDTMGVSSARVAVALNELEDKGLINRQIDDNDRRRIIVKLTQKGKLFTKEQTEIFVDSTAEMLKELGEYDAKEYVRITGRIVEITKKRNCNL